MNSRGLLECNARENQSVNKVCLVVSWEIMRMLCICLRCHTLRNATADSVNFHTATVPVHTAHGHWRLRLTRPTINHDCGSHHLN